ncbi:LysR family transcriptional regulator ArgP [Tersicoccus sp. MR15.9]|uniref:LysR family transcriptional regulator ArgP n=1 Tax=Tersicoccus mangrovi TaxID=3121635 RepID=UPI002FE68F24
MNVSTDQLAALVAVVDEGSFDGAAAVLHLTPSAVSQRIRALEESLGQVLVRRSRPVQPTEPGRAVLRTARQVLHLQHDITASLGGDQEATADGGGGVHRPTAAVSVAVNSDSLATWFMPALEALRAWGDVAVDLHRDDELRSADLLRDGRVMAAVAATPVRVQGCSVTPLGALRYHPVANPHVAARWFDGGVTPASLRRAPVVDFDREDSLQRRFVGLLDGGADPDEHGIADAAPRSYVPSSREYADAIRLGLGWGLVPTDQLDDRLVALDVGPGHLDVPLYWLRWTLDSPVLAALTDAVQAAARARLRPLAPPRGRDRRR